MYDNRKVQKWEKGCVELVTARSTQGKSWLLLSHVIASKKQEESKQNKEVQNDLRKG